MGFKTQQYRLAKLLEQAGNGEIQLPDFQRGYKWEEERIRSLLVTIVNGHPLGVIMLLETGNDNVRFKPKPIEGAPAEAESVEPDLLLLDGQQRLTSLYQSLTGDGVVDTEDSRRKRIRRRFYIRIDDALAGDSHRDEAVVSIPHDGIVRSNFNRDIDLDVSTPEKEREHGYFPINLAYDPAATMSWLLELGDKTQINRFNTEVLQPMLAYEIPAIQLDRSTTKGAVATVFEKVNTGGLPLNVFELLTATFAGDSAYFDEHGTDFRLNDDWAKTEEVFAQHPVLQNFSNNDFLQAVTLLSTASSRRATSAKKDDILRLELSDYLASAPRIRKSLVWVAQFLDHERIHTAKDVPYQTQLVPLAVIHALLGDDASLHGVLARLRQWYWCGVLGESYGSATETRFARDVDQVPAWAMAAVDGRPDAPTPMTVADSNFFESRLISLSRRNSAAYKGVYALLMATGCADWKYNKQFDRAQYLNLDVDIHHIFPRKWCQTHEIDSRLRESIVNKTPLGASTNRFVGGQSPAAYLPKIERSAGITAAELDTIVATHLIDTDALRAADFDRFFTRRREALLELVEAAMGKPAQRDIEQDDPMGGEESPDAFADEPDDPGSVADESEESAPLDDVSIDGED